MNSNRRAKGRERDREEEREGRRRMEGGDGGRQQVVVMHRATFSDRQQGSKRYLR